MIASEGALDRIRLHGIASSSKLMGQSNRYGDKAGVGRLAHAGMRDLDSAKVKNRIELHTIHAPNPEPKELAGTHRAEVLREMLAEFRREFTDVIGAEQVILQIEEPGKAPYNIIADALIRYTDADGNVRYHIGEAKLSQIRGLTGNLSKEQLYSTLTDGQRSGFSAIVNRVEGLEIRILGKTKIEVVFDLAAQKPDGARYYQSENPIRVDPEISIRTRSHENGTDGILDTRKWVDTNHLYDSQRIAIVRDDGIKVVRQSELEAVCFAGDTRIVVEGGKLVHLEFLGPGSLVLSRCEKTGETAFRKVVKRFHREAVPTCLLFFRSFTDHPYGHMPIETTAEHPFWVRGKGWVRVMDLQPDDVLEGCHGIETTVRYVEATNRLNDVYNLEVEEFNTYFVEGGLWVHNCNVEGVKAYELLSKADGTIRVLDNKYNGTSLTPSRAGLETELLSADYQVAEQARAKLGPDKFETKIPENGTAIDIRSARTEIESVTQRNPENCSVGAGNTPLLHL